MIDLQLYRLRIGGFNGFGPKRTCNNKCFSYDSETRTFVGANTPNKTFVFNAIIYTLLSFLSLSLLILSYCNNHIFLNGDRDWTFPYSRGGIVGGLPFLSLVYLKIAYLILVLKAACRFHKIKHKHSSILKFCVGTSRYQASKLKTLLVRLFLAIVSINFMLIAIVNPSLLNPGPQNLSIYYQNVRGLIPFSNLKQPHPNLDSSKVYELNSYIALEKPGVILLSETWLKKSIKDQEVIANNNYNVYRSDRSQFSHPGDPNDPSKYKKYGGGVLIATRSDIDASFKRISMRRGAEIVAVEITINNIKFIFCVVYRVGTLGSDNHNNIVNSIKPFFRGKKVKKIFIVGDFNLIPTISMITFLQLSSSLLTHLMILGSHSAYWIPPMSREKLLTSY